MEKEPITQDEISEEPTADLNVNISEEIETSEQIG